MTRITYHRFAILTLSLFLCVTVAIPVHAHESKRIQKLIEALREDIRDFETQGYTCGTASYYGQFHHNKPMKNGELFDMGNPRIVANKTLPLETDIEVINLSNRRAITATVKDRGPYKHERILDLSAAGAAKLGFTGEGVAVVCFRIV